MKIWLYVFITKLIFWIPGVRKIHWWLWMKRIDLVLEMTNGEHVRAMNRTRNWKEAHPKLMSR